MDYVDAITIDKQNNIWIATFFGLVKFDGTNWTVYNSSNSGLPGDIVHCIAIDDAGNKWIGLWGDGLVKFDGNNWTVYTTKNSGLPCNSVSTIAIDRNGNKWIGTVDGLGIFREGGVLLDVKKTNRLTPERFYLAQNYPNPFGSATPSGNPTTTIKYSIPAVISNPNEVSGEKSQEISPPSRRDRNDNVQVTLKIYDVLGREITTLVNERQQPGNYSVQFNAGSASGGLPSGVYFYRLQAGEFSAVKKMILLK